LAGTDLHVVLTLVALGHHFRRVFADLQARHAQEKAAGPARRREAEGIACSRGLDNS